MSDLMKKLHVNITSDALAGKIGLIGQHDLSISDSFLVRIKAHKEENLFIINEFLNAHSSLEYNQYLTDLQLLIRS